MELMEVWKLKMESWSFCRPVIADSQYFDEEQYSDPHKTEKLDPDPINVMRIRNPDFLYFVQNRFKI
jgi:hypothetical protein